MQVGGVSYPRRYVPRVTAVPQILPKVIRGCDTTVFGVELNECMEVFMPNRAEHTRVGVAVGAFFALVFAEQQTQGDSNPLAEVIGGSLGGWLGGIMPDILEPGTSSYHRDFAHSLALAGTSVRYAQMAEWQAACRSRAALCDTQARSLVVASSQRSQVELVALFWRVLAGALVGFGAGYISHLVLDGGTPRGIPLIGRAMRY